jgi:UbiD family decarboxylase
MTHRTMREFLAALEKKRLLRRIAKPVDRTWEPGAMVKWMYQALPEEARFGMWFERVSGSSIPFVTGALGASTATFAAALEVTPEAIGATIVNACLNPLAPRLADAAPCQEVVLTGDAVKLSALPVPVWTPGKDKGPYVTTCVVTKNCDTGVHNTGVYRTLVRDEKSLICNLSPRRQGQLNALTWNSKGRPAPIAWVIAAPPAVHIAATANLPYGKPEIELAGALQGAPVDMVRAKTQDLLVPAEAEIVIEGEVHPGEMEPEGPFGEFAGYMGPVEPRPVVRVTAITQRRDPIYYGLSSQMPPSESTVVQSLTNAALLLKVLRHDLGEFAATDAYIDLTFGGSLAHAIIAAKPRFPGHGRKIGRMAAEILPVKRVTVVDDYVDIRDPVHLEWALNSHYNPARDTVLIDDVSYGRNMDPSLRGSNDAHPLGSKIVVDATLKVDAGPFSLPSREIMDRALASWREAGLPDFAIPKRARLRFERS